MQTQLPIEVDERTGIWTTDGLPMIYVPRHFFVNNHVEAEAAIGREAYAESLYKAGYRSAYYWCEQESKTHGLQGLAVYEHYLKRLSQRGWGQFTVDEIDIEEKRGQIALRNSIFVLEQQDAGRAVCYMFEGFMTGALRYLLDTDVATAITCTEEICAAAGHASCRFFFAAPRTVSARRH